MSNMKYSYIKFKIIHYNFNVFILFFIAIANGIPIITSDIVSPIPIVMKLTINGMLNRLYKAYAIHTAINNTCNGTAFNFHLYIAYLGIINKNGAIISNIPSPIPIPTP